MLSANLSRSTLATARSASVSLIAVDPKRAAPDWQLDQMRRSRPTPRSKSNRGAFSLAPMSDSPHRPRMSNQHYSERVRGYSDEELRTELLKNDPSWGASQIVRNEIDRRRQARTDRYARIGIGIGIVTILVAVVGIVFGF